MRLGRALAAMAGGAWLAAGAALAGPAQPEPAEGETGERRGEILLERHCATCHAIGRTGSSPHPEASPLRNLSKKYPIEALEEALAEGILTGHPDMPEFAFHPKDVGAIIAYLESIQTK